MKHFHNFRLDVPNLSLWKGGDRISITPKAYAVLRYFVDNAGRLITQDEILESVWPETYVQPEVLRKYILEIRKVLGDPPKHPVFIETLPKRGYQFIAPVTDAVPTAIASQPASPRKIVGRSAALDTLGNAFREARDAKRRVVFITGETGIGKTSVVDAFEQTVANTPGLRVARGQCVEGFGSKEAYYPVLDAIGHLIHADPDDFIVKTLAAHAPTWLVHFPAFLSAAQAEALQRDILGATRERMLREICQAFDVISAAQPLLLVLEDLHWSDHHTLDLLSVLARRRDPARLLVLGTYRPIDVKLAHSPLQALKQDLLVHRICQEISLNYLSAEDIAEYLAIEFPNSNLPFGLATLIHRHSDGNSLFMTQIVAHLVGKGILARHGESWQLSSPLSQLEPGVPETLQEMLDLQLDGQDAATQSLLKAASIEGTRFSAWAVAAMLGRSQDDVENDFDRLAEKQQFVKSAGLENAPDGSPTAEYQFVHSLHQEVFHRRIGASQKARLHLALAERLEAWAGPSNQIALHFEEGRNAAKASEHWEQAARLAGQKHGHRDEIGILNHVLELLRQLPIGDAVREWNVLINIGNANYALGEMAPSTETYFHAADLAKRENLGELEIQALMKAAWPAAFIDPARCLGACHRACEVAAFAHDPLLQARTNLVCASWQIIFEGWTGDASQSCKEAVNRIRSITQADLPAQEEILYSHVLSVEGQYLEASNNLARGIDKLIEEDRPIEYLAALSGRAMALIYSGDWGLALETANVGASVASKNGNEPWLGIFQAIHAWLQLMAFDVEGSHQLSELLLTTDWAEPAGQVWTMASITYGCAELLMGKHHAASEHFRTVLATSDRRKFFLHWQWRQLARLMLARALLAAGDIEAAQHEAAAAWKTTKSGCDPAFRAIVATTQASIALASNEIPEAREFIQKALDAMAPFDVPPVAWRTHHVAAQIFNKIEDTTNAEHHERLTQAIMSRLAHSFEKEERLRKTVLAFAVTI
jgi:DNA-binding winged helix-turn-helix (wHTH) protein